MARIRVTSKRLMAKIGITAEQEEELLSLVYGATWIWETQDEDGLGNDLSFHVFSTIMQRLRQLVMEILDA